MPKFSVIITVYNKELFIMETLQSVLNQSVQDFEIIIVDDASTDSSNTIINSALYDKISLISLPTQEGAAAARNIGIKNAKGDYIALLDGDDLWDPDHLFEINLLIKEYPHLKAFATSVTHKFKRREKPFTYALQGAQKSNLLELEYFANSYKDSILRTSATVLDKSIFDNIGYFDPSIISGQDTDMWIRVGLVSNIGFSTRLCVFYRHVNDSLYNTTKSVSQKLTFLKYLKEEKTNPSLKKFIDLNRYALILRARLWGEFDKVATYQDHLDVGNLNKKQRFLLKLPPRILKGAFKFQEILDTIGIKLSAF